MLVATPGDCEYNRSSVKANHPKSPTGQPCKASSQARVGDTQTNLSDHVVACCLELCMHTLYSCMLQLVPKGCSHKKIHL